ncbi:MAG: hypothetical protein GWP08_13335 [Nitrospiraceae bacterium]|nr:hypothetical protein [Nitrospiraceae bacterium]
MKMRSGVAVLMMAMALWVPAALAEVPTLEAIEKAVVEKWDALTSMSGTLDLALEFKLNPNMAKPVPLMGGGDVAYLKKDNPLYRSYIWVGIGQSKLVEAQAVSDGAKTQYEASVPMAQVRESGTVDTAEIGAPGGKPLFDMLREHLVLSALPDAKIGEKPAYAIAAKPKEDSDEVPVSTLEIFFDQETGIPVKLRAVGKDGAEMGSLTMKDLKINETLGEGVFTFKSILPPAPPAPAAPAAPAAQAQPADAPKE